MDFTVMDADARMTRIHVLAAILPFGATLLLGTGIIWCMLYTYVGPPVFMRRVRIPLCLLSGLVWGLVQHWRGGGLAGSIVLGIEAAIVTAVAALTLAKGIDAYHART